MISADSHKKRITPEQEEQLANRLLKASHEKRIPCASAMDIAKSLGIPLAEVGRTADKLKIRIKKCQLGCF